MYYKEKLVYSNTVFASSVQLAKYQTTDILSFCSAGLESQNSSVQQVEMSLSGKSFLVRSAGMWNAIPTDIRNIRQVEGFKKCLKSWIKSNVEIE